MITYTYDIVSKPTAAEINDFPNVIVASVWTYTGIDDFTNKSASLVNTTFFVPPPVDDPNFIPYDEVTDELVFSWISTRDDIPAMQLYLAEQIAIQNTTTTTTTIYHPPIDTPPPA
jgi:hypothetical protein